jgi:nucleoside-diphosphate-sugar epimerase
MPRLAADFVRNEADISKARRLLGYNPQVSVAEVCGALGVVMRA